MVSVANQLSKVNGRKEEEKDGIMILGRIKHVKFTLNHVKRDSSSWLEQRVFKPKSCNDFQTLWKLWFKANTQSVQGKKEKKKLNHTFIVKALLSIYTYIWFKANTQSVQGLSCDRHQRCQKYYGSD